MHANSILFVKNSNTEAKNSEKLRALNLSIEISFEAGYLYSVLGRINFSL